MRKPAFNFYCRISPEADARRRRLEERLQCSATRLAEQALESLEDRLDAAGKERAAA